MVSFNCESCNDVIKKPKLDAHRGRCHNAVFSCIDCSATFQGTAYRTHTSCISEEQKYQGALYRPDKSKGKKGANVKKEEPSPAPAPAPTLAPVATEVADVEMKEAEPVVEKTPKKVKKEKKEKKNKKGKKDKKVEEAAPAVEERAGEAPAAEATKEDKAEKKSKRSEKRTEETASAAEEEKAEETPAAPVVRAEAAAPEEERSGKKAKTEMKGKKRKLDVDAEIESPPAASKIPAKKSKREDETVKAETNGVTKKAAPSPAVAKAFLERIKAGRPLSFQKVLTRVEKDMGENFNSADLFSMLRLKREKDGNIIIAVAGANEGKK